MESYRIGILSDTHGLLRPEAKKQLEGCEAIFHAGDVGSLEVAEELEKISKCYIVCGNADQKIAKKLPAELAVDLHGFCFYMVHNRRDGKSDFRGVDFFICGHSHKYEERKEGSLSIFNPGSCGPKRFRLPVTMMLLTLYPQNHCFKTQRIDLMQKDVFTAEDDFTDPEKFFPAREMDRLIRGMIKEMNAGKTVAEIASKHHVPEELAEQICRIYATHPGVDVDGILNRMEIKNR